ncbi:ABC transporter substrate-binding protein [Rhizobium laguerreae]|uniref:ABC transporter substrate-binding protein n=1 Tax=Rhizobium laguerreae TaxID=1076926 RepID=UPI001C9134EA|nr:ABC transporter substrate-binding protein [Rhizobium laguerreae]MBY3307800.1 ABC transporter substrate-binding protein [Rhizobium laguerreae]
MTWKVLFGAITVSFLVIAGSATGTRAETPADQLVVGLGMGNILSMDPGQSGSAEADIARANMYDRLLELDAKTFEAKPQLATEWKVSDEGKLFSFKIREGATFASGNPLTADDIVWTFRRLLTKEMSGGTQLRTFGFTAQNADERVRISSNGWVELELNEAIDPTLFYNLLAINSFSIVDSKLAMSHDKDGDMGGGWLATNSAGSGPFVLSRYEPNNIALFDRNPHFWGKAPAMKRFIIRHMPESQTQRLSLERGDIDLAISLSGADLTALTANKDVKIDYEPDGGFYFLAVSEEQERFKDKRVREALRYLVDYKGLADTVLRHYGTAWTGPLAPHLQPQIEAPQWPLDPDKAKALLAEAGFPDGMDVTLRALSDTPFADLATAIQASLAKGGIRAKIITGGGSVVYDKMRERDFDMVVGRGGSVSPHPYAMATILYNADNSADAKLYSFHSWRVSQQDPGMNRLLDQARVERDPAKRTELYKQVQQEFYDMVSAWQPIAAVVNPFALRSDVQNLAMHPTRVTRLIDVTKSR